MSYGQTYQEYRTGEVCLVAGEYAFVRHMQEPPYCSPTDNERFIPLDVGDRFPPHKSCEKGAIWRLHRRT